MSGWLAYARHEEARGCGGEKRQPFELIWAFEGVNVWFGSRSSLFIPSPYTRPIRFLFDSSSSCVQETGLERRWVHLRWVYSGLQIH